MCTKTFDGLRFLNSAKWCKAAPEPPSPTNLNIMDKALYTLHKARPGVGGFHCSCCNPAFGNFKGPDSRRHRQAAKRALRRTERQHARNAGIEELHQQFIEAIHEYNHLMIDFGMEDQYIEYNWLHGVIRKPVPEPSFAGF